MWIPWRSRQNGTVENDDKGAVLTLDNLTDKYIILDEVPNPHYGSALVVVDRNSRAYSREGARQLAATREGRVAVRRGEIGSARTKWRSLLGNEEYNADLAGTLGIEKYDEMRRQDATVRTSLRMAKTPVLSGRWNIEPKERDNPEAELQAKFIHWALFENMTISWEQILMEALLMLEFGYYMFELVYDIQTWEGQPRIVWKKWAPRNPIDVAPDGWAYDDHGGPDGVYMVNFEGEQEVFIPIEKMVVFTYDRETNNMEGIPLLRSAYKHWYFKDNLYKIDAIQKERHGIGIPVIKLPPGFTDNDKLLANEMGRNLRTNEQAHVVLPPMWELFFAKVEGNPTDPVSSIDHHDKQISKNALAQWLETGAAASKEQEIDIFMKAMRFTADIIRWTINKHAIPQLIGWNFSNPLPPSLRVRRIGEANELRTLSFAARNFIGAGLVIPDDKLEAWVRDELDMPAADPSTARIQQTPQNPFGGGGGAQPPSTGGGTPRPPHVGPPRQPAPSPTPGQDRSGGA